MPPTSKKKVPRPSSARTPGQSPDRPEPPQVAGLTDLTEVETIYAPQVKTVRLRTIHIKHDPAIPAPSRDTLPPPLEPDALVPLAQALLARHDVDQEHFIMLTCNAKHRPYGFKHIASGGKTELLIDPTIVFRSALLFGAASIIVLHNHPSGDPTPSTEDLHLTVRLVTFGDLINIPVLDHCILGRGQTCRSLHRHRPDLWS